MSLTIFRTWSLTSQAIFFFSANDAHKAELHQHSPLAHPPPRQVIGNAQEKIGNRWCTNEETQSGNKHAAVAGNLSLFTLVRQKHYIGGKVG